MSSTKQFTHVPHGRSATNSAPQRDMVSNRFYTVLYTMYPKCIE